MRLLVVQKELTVAPVLLGSLYVVFNEKTGHIFLLDSNEWMVIVLEALLDGLLCFNSVIMLNTIEVLSKTQFCRLNAWSV